MHRKLSGLCLFEETTRRYVADEVKLRFLTFYLIAPDANISIS